MSCMSCLNCHVKLKVYVKLKIISHGNAHMQLGFSVNEKIIVENMSESPFVA